MEIKHHTPLSVGNLIVEWVLIFFILTWTLKPSFNNAAIIICILIWLGLKGYESISELIKNPFVQWSIAIVLVSAISIVYSENKEEAWTSLGRKILLPIVILIFPFLVSLVNKVSIYRAYILVWLIASLYSIVITFMRYGLDINNISYFSWLLPNSLNMDSTYYALFIGLSFMLVVSDIMRNQIFSNKLVSLGLTLYFFCFLGLLSSRLPFFSASFIVLFFPYFNASNWSKKHIFLYTIVVIIVTSFFVLASPFLRNKVTQLIQQNDPRFIEWKAGLTVFMDNPLLGVGIGDVNNELMKEYEKLRFDQGIAENFNVHNEFLHEGMMTGIIGIFLICLISFMCLLYSFKLRNYKQFGFSVIYIACLLSEVMLNRQKGITVLAFFLVFIFIKYPNEESAAR